jgi:flagellar hook-length control protein FliK
MALLTLLQPTPSKSTTLAKAGGSRPEEDAGSSAFSQALGHSRTDGDPTGTPAAAGAAGPSAPARATRTARATAIPATPTQPGQRRDRSGPADGRQRLALGEPADGTEQTDLQRGRSSAPLDSWSADPMAAQALVARLTMDNQTEPAAMPPTLSATVAPATAVASEAGSSATVAVPSATSEAVPTVAPTPVAPSDLTQPVTVSTASTLPTAAATPTPSTVPAPATPTLATPPSPSNTRLSTPAAPRQSGEPVPMPAQAPELSADAPATNDIDQDRSAPESARSGMESAAKALTEASGMAPASQSPVTVPTSTIAATAMLGPTRVPGTIAATVSATGSARPGASRSERDSGRVSGSGVARDWTAQSARASVAGGEFTSVSGGAAGALLRVPIDPAQVDATPFFAAQVDASPNLAGSLSPSTTSVAAAGLVPSSQPHPVAPPSARLPEPAQVTLPMSLDSPSFAPALGAQVSVLVRDGRRSTARHASSTRPRWARSRCRSRWMAARPHRLPGRRGWHSPGDRGVAAGTGSALQEAGLTLAGGGVFQQSPGRQDAQGTAGAAQPGQPRRQRRGTPRRPADHRSCRCARSVAWSTWWPDHAPPRLAHRPPWPVRSCAQPPHRQYTTGMHRCFSASGRCDPIRIIASPGPAMPLQPWQATLVRLSGFRTRRSTMSTAHCRSRCPAATQASGGKKKLIIIIAAVLLVVLDRRRCRLLPDEEEARPRARKGTNGCRCPGRGRASPQARAQEATRRSSPCSCRWTRSP